MTGTHTIDLDAIRLLEGEHETREQGMCVMELTAYLAGEDAAGDAADLQLAPTVRSLQASAFDLLDRMIAVGRTEAVAPR